MGESSQTGSANRQLAAAILVGALALCFDLLFFAVDELPSTVPVAVGLALTQWKWPADGVSWPRP